MALFGRKASTPPPAQVPTPSAPTADVPPELQPYYTATPVAAPAQLRRMGLFVLPLIVFLVVLALLIGGTIWLRHHSLGDLFGGSKKGSASQQTQSTTPSTEVTNPGTAEITPTPSTPTTSQPSTTPTTTPATTTPNSAIPNTGPNDSLFALAAMVALVGTVGFHMYQVRRMQPTI